MFVEETGQFAAEICSPDETRGDAALLALTDAHREASGDDPEFVTVLTAGIIGCDIIFYLPLANDVTGIGSRHQDPRDVYDDTPDSRLEGVLFLNDVPYWQEHPDEIGPMFNQEFGHRWGALVHADLGEGETAEILGRDGVHWSYFLHTEASPLEGNRWIDNGDGTFTTATEPDDATYSPLDLYLMGLLPPEEVPPTFLLRPAGEPCAMRDCFDGCLTAASPPQFCENIIVEAERVDVTIDDVIAVEGARSPAHTEAPRSFSMVFLVVAGSEDLADPPPRAQLDGLVDDMAGGFADGTGGLATLEVMSGRCVGDGCGCRLGAAASRDGGAAAHALILCATPLLCLLLRQRRRAAA